MAIITMLVGLGVLLAFTVLGCVLEVSGQEGEHMAGTGPAYPRRPVCGGDGAEADTVAPDTPGTRCWAACWRYSWFRASRLFCC